MNYISAFYNTSISGAQLNRSEQLSNFMFKPVRYFYKGSELLAERNGDSIKLTRLNREASTAKKTIVSIILLAPAIILGTFVKCFSLLSTSAREHFKAAVLHRTTIETKEVHLTADKAANKLQLEDPYLRNIKNLIVHGNDEPIGPEDELDFQNVRIAERLVLHNCWLSGTMNDHRPKRTVRQQSISLEPAAALHLQGFEESSKLYDSINDFHMGDIFRGKRSVYQMERTYDTKANDRNTILTDVYSNFDDFYGPKDSGYTVNSPDDNGQLTGNTFVGATRDAFIAHMRRELPLQLNQDKARLYEFFREHPNNVLTHVFSHSQITERVVENLDSALSQKVRIKHWWNPLEMRPKMFVYFDSPPSVLPTGPDTIPEGPDGVTLD